MRAVRYKETVRQNETTQRMSPCGLENEVYDVLGPVKERTTPAGAQGRVCSV